MAAGDVQIALPNGPAPTSREIVGQVPVRPKAVNATFDGTGAAGAFLPCLVITGKEGFEVARIPAPQVAAGASAEVSWFPRVGGSGGGGGGGGIQFDVDNQGGYLQVETSGASPGGHGIDLADNAAGNRLILGPTATLTAPGGIAQVVGGAGVNIVTLGAGGLISLYNQGKTGIGIQDAGTHSEVNIGGDRIGFFGTAAIVQPTVTGSRGGNAALASLLTKLATLGLIVDGTTP